MAKDLLDYVSFSHLECLNENPAKPATNALKQGYREDSGLTCESDTDEQLLLNIPFNQKVGHTSTADAGSTHSNTLLHAYVHNLTVCPAS
jgi:hypothetical protein